MLEKTVIGLLFGTLLVVAIITIRSHHANPIVQRKECENSFSTKFSSSELDYICGKKPALYKQISDSIIQHIPSGKMYRIK